MGSPSPIRRRVLRTAQGLSYWSGLAALWAARNPSSAPAILMYHSVAGAEAAEWIAPANRLDARSFERQMRFLAARRSVVDLGEAIERLAAGSPLPARSVVLTFDDGYRDNLEVAAPILERHGLCATLYLPTSLVARGENPWADRLYAALRHRTRDHVALDGEAPVDLRSPAARGAWQRRLHARLLVARADERSALLDALEQALKPAVAARRQTLCWQEVSALARRFPHFALASHGAEHLDLTALPESEAAADIEASIRDFEAALGRRPEHFAFPYNRSTPALCALVPHLGLRSAMAGSGFLGPERPDPFALRRVEAPHSGTLLRLWTSGAHPGLSLALLGRA